ncbi:hypothetical protein SAMN04488026_101836 [Aliiruegeria lutimaris]|uniref:Uncharacterized protein n=1 Tax=Aliiruegeria lutimaris TaxID=571298 RepID=A0A1G8U2M3_9RHOB|nr:hypothetical protein SAMN04488026_101836 [Aliiruegeria lutimaris]
MRRCFHLLAALVVVNFLATNNARALSPDDLPPPFDEEIYLIERYWTWLKAEVNAPLSVLWPRIEIEPLPKTVRMAFVFPTEAAPWQETRIVISPRTVDRAAGPDRPAGIGELAHEVVHYILVLSENVWDAEADVLRNDRLHHCDHEFMRLSRKVSYFIWEVYHSNDAVRSVHRMVNLACWRDCHTIADDRGR